MTHSERKEKIERERLERTQELANDLKNGVYIQPRINLQESWFPNRGIIKKDKKAMRKLKEVGDGKST